MGLNLTVGYAGQKSLGHAAFFGIGAYTVAIMLKAGLNFWLGLPMAAASIGTDGIDGSSGVAGAMVDSTTLSRAAAAGLQRPADYLATNNSLAFFTPLDDVIRLGRTETNVGDLQAIVIP